jgi:DNA-directed RNA polymerase subunit N (RpoN/RPB10)
MPKYYESKAWLEKKFKKELKTKKQIADECGVDEMTIRRWLLRHKITNRL